MGRREPHGIIAVQQEQAQRVLKGLLKQQRDFERTVRSPRDYEQSPEELAHLLAQGAVPEDVFWGMG